LAGNPGKRPIADTEPKPNATMPECPKSLSTDAKTEWERIGPELNRLGLLTMADSTAFAAYCQAWSDWIQAIGQVNEEGAVLKSDKGNMYLNPWSVVASKSLELMNKFGAQFGLTPGSRRRLAIAPPEKEDEYAGYKNAKSKG
jgi:P27 family predicted phage terminase small subunit